MKTKILTLTFVLALFSSVATAQDRTTVNAYSPEISDNLDLRAVASVFGDSEDLADFERRLNDPKLQISNLDLNRDNMVDYLRVIESVEGNTHLIIIQSVIGRDLYQDVATVEVERDSRNRVQIQVVGDVYMYGRNYIYEPIYVHTPLIYSTFWIRHYRPYFSSWYWGYYPTYYYAWNPYPVHVYHNHIHVHVNNHHHYNYVTVRRSERAIALHTTRRANAYERQYPERSFTQRTNVTNRNELVATRNISETRNTATGTRNTTARAENSAGTRATTTRTDNTARAQTTTRPTATGTRTVDRAATQATTRNSAPNYRTNATGTRQNVAPAVRSATTQRSTSSPSTATTRSNSVQSTSRPSNISMNSQRTAPSINRPSATISRPASAPTSNNRVSPTNRAASPSRR